MNSNMNIFQLLQTAKTGGPRAMVMQMLGPNFKSNPMMNKMLALAQQGDEAALEQLMRNVFKEKGLDFDKEFTNFKQMLKL